MNETLKKWFPLWKHLLAVAVLVCFLAVILWNRSHFVGYFPEWLSRRMVSHIAAGLVAIALAYWGKWAVASGLTLGWVGGVPLAQTVGDVVRIRHEAMYTAEELVRIGNKHAYIWWMCIAIGVALGLIVQVAVWLRRKDRTRIRPVDNRDFMQYRET